MKKVVVNLFLLLIVILPNNVLAVTLSDSDTVICIGGSRYDITSTGSKVENIWDITEDNLEYMSMLPIEYFEMKEYIKNNNITGNFFQHAEFLRL